MFSPSRMSARSFAVRLGIAAGCLFSIACSKHLPLAAPAAPLSLPTRLCATGEAPPTCRDAREVEQLLASELTIVGMTDPPNGSQGAKLLTLRGRSGGRELVFRAKWRPQSSDDLINESRKELAACAVQKLFLDDTELVAPPTLARCLPLSEYRAFMPNEKATFPRVDCVFGYASYWLEDIVTVEAARKQKLLVAGDGILDVERFGRDRMYRETLANANLLTYAINHGDAHNGQFLLQSTRQGYRAFVVDNSISFQSIKNPMLLFREDWSQIQVPALPKHVVERLSRLSDADYAALASVEQLEHRGTELVPLPATTPPAKSDGNAFSWNGNRLRVGLTAREIELVKSRIHELLARPDLTKLATMP